MRLNFNWKLTVFVVICLPIVIRLGFWQLDRAKQKEAIIAAQQSLMAEAAVALEVLPAEQWQPFRNVGLRGTFGKAIFLVDNQMYKSQFGYEVVQPFSYGQGQMILVSRGWVPGSLDRRQLPPITTPAGEQQLQGYLYQPGKLIKLGETEQQQGWPQVVPSASVENMYKLLGKNDKISPHFLVRLAENSPALFTAHWQLVNVLPERHIGYAVQWFLMAGLLVVLFIYASIRKTGADKEATPSE